MKKNCCYISLLLTILLSQLYCFGHEPTPTDHKPFHYNRVTSCSNDSIVLTRQSQIDSFPITNPACSVLRKLKIDGFGATPAITRLDSLRHITQVTEEFTISDVDATSLSALTGLAVLGGQVTFQSNYLMNGLGLPPAINMSQVTSLTLINLPELTDISELKNKVRGNQPWAILIFYTGLTSLAGLDSLHHTDFLNISNNNRLQSLHGLEGLSAINFNCTINDNDSLTSLTGLNNLDSMVYTGYFECSYNDMLTSFAGLSNLRYMEGGLWIQGNDNLATLSDLNPSLFIHDYLGDSVRIINNPLLAVCESPPICNFLDNFTTAHIENNAPGCNSIAEVQAACNAVPPCSGILKTWNGSINTLWNDSLNWTPFGTPGTCDTVLISSSLTNYPELSGDISIGGLIMENGSSLECGNALHVNINGDINIDHASIYSADSVVVNNAANVQLSHMTILYVNNFVINEYRGPLQMEGCSIGGNLAISDHSSRTITSYINANYIHLNFEITANSIDTAAVINISQSVSDTVNGNAIFKINAPSHVNVGSNKILRLNHDLVVNSNFEGYPFLRAIEFRHPVNPMHVIQAGTAKVHIDSVSLPGALLVLDNDLHINKFFHFHSGRVKSNTGKSLIFENNATWDIFNSGSYTWGPVKKIGNQAFYFPTGDSLYQRPFAMSAPAQPSNAYTAQYFHEDPSLAGYDTSHHAPSLNKIFSKEYWKLSRDNGTSKVKLSFDYDTSLTGPISSPYDLRLARWNGSQWENLGLGEVQIFSDHSGRVISDSISSFGPFALAQAPHHIPVITIASADSVGCAGGGSMVHFTLDTLMYSNNVFKVQFSDSAGVFADPFPAVLGSISSNHSDSIFSFFPGNTPAGNHYKIRVVGDAPPDTSNTKTIKVIPFPTPGIVVHGPAVTCYGGGVYKYWVTPVQPGISYAWSVNGGDTLTTNYDTAYVRFSYVGFHSVAVINSSPCRTGTLAQQPVDVSYPAPTVTPGLTNTGRWLFSTAPAANQHSLGYHWYRNDTLISGANNNSYYASATGTYKVRYYNLCNDGPSSNTISFATTSLPQTISFPALPNKTYGDPDFVIPATASSGLPVSFSISSGPGSIPGNFYHITTTGVATIRATQPGDDVYDTAAPVNRTFTISKASQTITFPVISEKDLAATTQFPLNATSSSGLSISYIILSGPATVNGTNLTLTGLGTVTIRAIQPGDTNYLAATAVDRSFCVRVSSLNPISGPVSTCPTINVTYSVNNIAGATYTWRIAGGSVLPSTTHTVTLIWPSPGTYTLIAKATGSCGAVSNDDSLTITAITSVQPDSVHGMLPANAAINQQLPLTLSWIPANPNLYYIYDLYLWRADTTQPVTPYVSNLTSISYTIPINSGLPYGQTYKWMIAAHNGSCTVTTGGPIQTFSLIPLPDLQVYNINAPTTALSGQPVSVTWKVKNNGPGNTQVNQHWTDAVFISVDSVLNLANPNPFPTGPSLVAAKPNITALNTGQSYDDTATFTIPVTYSGPLYMHVVTNYAPPALNPVIENTLVNDTAHALPPTAVILSPQPDLRVDTVVNPNNTFSGSTINITFKVKNFNVNATGNWIDKVYISKDAVFNINTATLLKFPNTYGNYYPASDAVTGHSNGLQQDSSYTVSIPVVVPNFIYGSYYVYVFTNANGNLYEGPNNNNNINHGNLMQVFLTATPKITPLSISVASGVSTTQSVPVTWAEQNQGAYDNIQRNLGHYWVRYYPLINCNPYQPSYRDSLGYGSSYWIDRIYLSTDSSGLNIPASTLLGEVPHGTPNISSQLGAYPDHYCESGVLVNENTYNAILPNFNYPGSYAYAVPDNLPQGDYYMYVYANPTKIVYEYPGTPQVVRSNKITVSWPDLTVPSVTVPTTGNSGQPFTVNYTILNAGPGAVYNHYRKDYIYMGNSSTFNGSAVLLDSVIYTSASVPLNISQSLQKTITLPNGVSGSKFIFIRTNGDSTFKETNLNNNTNTPGAPVTIILTPSPDLQVSSIVMNDTVFSGLGFPFKYTVTNTGSGLASGAWKDSIFISCSNIFNSSTAYFVGVRTQQNYIPAGGNYSDSFTLYIRLTFLINNSGCLADDTAHAYFFIKTNANNGLYESVTNNNTGVTSQKTIFNALVDHTITNVTSADSAWVGQYFKTKWTVKNLGYAPEYGSYYMWSDRVIMTTDSIPTANPQLIYFNGQEMQRLEHNQTYTDSISALLPNMPSGYYYLFTNTNALNQIVAEHNLTNNLGLRRNAAGQPIRVYVTNNPPADLTDSITAGPSTAAVGQPVKIIYQVRNNGVTTTNSNSWNDDIWLSNSLQLGGVYLGSKNHIGALATGQSYIDSFTVYIPINQVQGNYVIVVRANSSISFYENNYNNNLAFRYMSVYTPAPTDLVVSNINAADTLILGKITSVNWSIGNISNNPANGYETDGIYLGSDSLTNSNNDILIGTNQNQLNILPLASAAQNSLPVVSGVTEGTYFLKVKTDILNNILETNKLNNTGTRSGRVYVKVNVLPMNISVPDTLRPSYLFYKLVIPAALAGKTIQVKLTSNDSLTANNQLYIGLGYVPSAAHFDYTYNNANYGNQQIVIESVVDSVYYIAAKGTKPNTAYQLVSLKAVELPFSITSVNANRGGNTGNVTIQIKGSLFSNDMTARIHGVALNNNIGASAIYFINSTTLYATFDLAGKPLGSYDVILKKPDSSVAILPAGFTIEITNNGGLITGSGPNTGQVGSGNAPGCDPGASSGLNSQLQTEIVIPPNVFPTWPFVIQINFTNTSNVDIPAQVKILYSLDDCPLSFTEAGLVEEKKRLYIEFKDANGPANIIRAGGTGTIRVYSKAPTGTGLEQDLYFNLE